jgi:WD40 repeat protein
MHKWNKIRWWTAFVTEGPCREIITGGGDGLLNIWQLNAVGAFGTKVGALPMIIQGQSGIISAPMVRALDEHPLEDKLVVGTASCDIWEVSRAGDAKLVLFGHQSGLMGIAMNPKAKYSHIFASTSDAATVAIWCTATRRVRFKVFLITSRRTRFSAHQRCPRREGQSRSRGEGFVRQAPGPMEASS